jgi:hypothetical protein
MRYGVGVIAIVAAAFLAIFLILARGGDKPTTRTKQPLKLVEYASRNSEVTLTTQGRIVGLDKFKSVRISVSAQERTIDVLTGYNGDIEKTQTLTNTEQAYDAFLHALQTADFMRTKKALYPDERGVCPLGHRYIYDLEDDNSQILHSWSANCGNVGTSAGRTALVRQLFQNQIPDYNKFTAGLQL